MFGRSRKKQVRRALRNKNLQKALDKAGSSHFAKFDQTRAEIPWDEIKAGARVRVTTDTTEKGRP